MKMFEFLIWSVVIVGVFVGYALFCRWVRKEGEEMLDEYQKRFPGRCPICSYHDYGVREGFIPPSPPDEHPGCLKKK
jgi:hypothetical protein